MGARAILIVPPFIKYNAGPLLGPSLLQAAARRHGYSCSVIDLNARWIKEKSGHYNYHSPSFHPPIFQGDHNKPGDNSLSQVEQQWLDNLVGLTTLSESNATNSRRILFGFLSQEEVAHSARQLATSASFGKWVHRELVENSLLRPPNLVGFSLLHAGQVIPATAISILVRELWPDALIVWGGPHITGLGAAIQDDVDKRVEFAADVFVQGHAEETFVELLDHLSWQDTAQACSGTAIPKSLKGNRGKFMHSPVAPTFDNLDDYMQPLTLPVQSSLGCAYGKCTFCTYPAMEGKPVQLSIDKTIEPIVRLAMEIGDSSCSGISLKDSLVTTKRLHDIAQCVQGRVRWSACTKLSPRLSDPNTLLHLRKNGLATLEVGLESLLPETQHRIRKVQSQLLFEKFVSHISNVSELSLVVNYMTGFPWEDTTESHEKFEETQGIVKRHLGAWGKVEHNKFELERLSPIARNPGKYGIDEKDLRWWPWASVVEHNPRN